MLKTTGAGAAGLSWVAIINEWSVQLFSVPLTVVGMAAAGTLLSFGYGPKSESRKKIYLEAMFVTFVSVCAVAVIPNVMDWTIKPELQAPTAGVIGALGRFAVDPLIKLIPELLRKIFRLDKAKDEKQET